MMDFNKQLKKLKKGDWVKVIWLDAATISKVPIDVNINEIPIATVTETVGQFIGILKDEKFHAPHFIVVTERSGDTETWTSIPLVLLKKVVRLVEKEALKSLKVCTKNGGFEGVSTILLKARPEGYWYEKKGTTQKKC
ncbi:MAG: hypothetical protein LZ158_02735 [Thaumarchaeota archaeon]|jgi:TusA-related sulfurtransferase|nr:hypothetical protein [Candidatus Terraquivivens yellowstonensis]MCL7387089.1 hypothetical protein [Candidatus Terraquivivens yellowstonensis]MCL7392669.1 hypothetical protein [Candidatus Terraquivivens yellowstonensis]MCL7394936.1 hypothetical protein [Candidatus Terraquivivens yellowstonensis]MCL7397907.1 hypothetical protein [Candidatus Terraquivivens yellowstonensis]